MMSRRYRPLHFVLSLNYLVLGIKHNMVPGMYVLEAPVTMLRYGDTALGVPLECGTFECGAPLTCGQNMLTRLHPT